LTLGLLGCRVGVMSDSFVEDVEGVDGPTSQVHRLGEFIIENFPGEPSVSEGAVDCAIRLLGAVAGREQVVPVYSWQVVVDGEYHTVEADALGVAAAGPGLILRTLLLRGEVVAVVPWDARIWRVGGVQTAPSYVWDPEQT
jgi:hypothetical protein